MRSTFSRARLWLVALIAVFAVAAPLAFAGQASIGRTTAYRLHFAPHVVKSGKAAPVGQVFGGTTSQGWPIVVEVSKDGKQVVRALTGTRLSCTSGTTATMQDGWMKLPLSKKGVFSATFGPQQVGSLPTGEAVIGQSAITGARNKAATKMTGTWSTTVTMVNTATGATADTCTTGALTWTAKQ